jgi:hypothetical protein
MHFLYRTQPVVDSKTSLEENKGGGGTCSNTGAFSSSSFSATPHDGAVKEGDGTIEAAGHF